MIIKRNKSKLYAGLSKEDFYFACTPLSQKITGLNMKLFVCPNFIKNLNPSIWAQNDYNSKTNDNILPFDIETQTISKYYSKKQVNLTKEDFKQLKQFILMNKKLLLEIWEQDPPYSSDEIWKK